MFWQRYRELADYEKVIKNIERGEQKIQRQQDIMNAIAAKLERYKNPWQELKVRDAMRQSCDPPRVLCVVRVQGQTRFVAAWRLVSGDVEAS
mgnify:CR=1 FL=1